MTIPYQAGLIYGPINSRRLGRSLGVNILPLEKKYCSFNCIYCQYGWTEHGKKLEEAAEYLPSFEEINAKLGDALKTYSEAGINIDYITFSGNGEPTLHPDFPEIVNLVKKLGNMYYPAAKSAILSNSTTVVRKGIRNALDALDVRIMKLDTGDEEILRNINCPVIDININEIVKNLKKLKPVHIQTLFLKGINDTEKSLDSWINYLIEINPVCIQIYSLDRPPADERLRKLSIEGLNEIVQKVKSDTGLKIEAF